MNIYLLIVSLLLLISTTLSSLETQICIIGSGLGGSSAAHFLRRGGYKGTIRMFERNSIVGGRIGSMVKFANGDEFEAGGTHLHPKNYHVLGFAKSLNLSLQGADDWESIGIWDGTRFVFKTLPCSIISNNSRFKFLNVLQKKILSLVNSSLMLFRYGFSLVRMNTFVENLVDRYMKYYETSESRPVFETVDEMLKWGGLHNLTANTLEEELGHAGVSRLLIQELVTVITRIIYSQSTSLNGLAGAVGLAGTRVGLSSVKGGNWQIVAGLIKSSNVMTHLDEEITSIYQLGDHYELSSSKGNSYACGVAVIATPLDELDIQITPAISIPERKMQHIHITYIRGFLNPAYFGLDAHSEVPELVGTLESPNLLFSCLMVLKKHGEKDMMYRVVSDELMPDSSLDQIFSVRNETIRINWAAFPQYKPPERFAPIILDERHLYYINAFENAASTMETSAVAAENVARLILSRLSLGGKPFPKQTNPRTLESSTPDTHSSHSEL